MKKQMIFLTIAMLFSGLAMAHYTAGEDYVIQSSDFEKQGDSYGNGQYNDPKTEQVGLCATCGGSLIGYETSNGKKILVGESVGANGIAVVGRCECTTDSNEVGEYCINTGH